ncbi:MAG: type I glyceraldehyde-3-phosphate dehydrogenase [Myxococcota bacterium]|nr:type I glyceraldehyde-3-phosphate dehydrogenase [Myxococcota bacterium]
MATRVAINGFGRIGRNVLRTAINEPDVEIVHINDLASIDLLAHLLKYDSVHGPFDAAVEAVEGGLTVNGKFIATSAERNPTDLPWAASNIDVVMECTGLFRSREKAALHLEAGAKKVIISAPGVDPDATVCVGVNEGILKADDLVVSNASCTTNCLAPMAKVLHESFGIEEGLITTIHSYTMDQRLLDSTHKDFRRARAAAQNMVPTTTGAAAAVGLVLPDLAGKLNGMSVRVPTPNVSIVDLVFRSTRPMTVETINAALAAAANGPMAGVLAYSEEPLVSSDLIGNPNSSIIDGLSTQMMGDRMAKVLAWYDNEWGFSNRMVDLTKTLASLG